MKKIGKFTLNVTGEKALRTEDIKFVRMYQSKKEDAWIVFGSDGGKENISFGKFNTREEAKLQMDSVLKKL